ncbi:hypothetical protein ACJJIG_18585 [Microbulbifer sp. SSSA007]|uniref:WapI family immunity protein n=1 Tax=Microbulbifer sp. SSSA007 TaxID=3243379 RepID=UPI004039F4EC
MFKLSNVENRVDLELSIEGYQFPDSPTDDWCFVRILVKQDDDTYEVIDPALEATELHCILKWFRCLSERKLPRYAQLTFTEPCLEFKFLACTDSSVRVSICLSHELKPSFDLKQFGLSASDWSVVFELGDSEFNRIISDIEKTLLRYPIRDQS